MQALQQKDEGISCVLSQKNEGVFSCIYQKMREFRRIAENRIVKTAR